VSTFHRYTPAEFISIIILSSLQSRMIGTPNYMD